MPPTRNRTRARAILLLAATAIALAACGSVKASGAGTGTGTTAQTTGWPASPAGTWGKQPTVVVPSSPPPTHLVSENLITGKGTTAVDGDHVTVQYVLVSYATKQVIQSSWSSAPYTFQLGEGQVIAGWDQGVPGMKAGGRRELIIPPALAYGDNPPQGIAANATLIFVVDLLKVTPA